MEVEGIISKQDLEYYMDKRLLCQCWMGVNVEFYFETVLAEFGIRE
jgi:hypothetical protein